MEGENHIKKKNPKNKTKQNRLVEKKGRKLESFEKPSYKYYLKEKCFEKQMNEATEGKFVETEKRALEQKTRSRLRSNASHDWISTVLNEAMAEYRKQNDDSKPPLESKTDEVYTGTSESVPSNTDTIITASKASDSALITTTNSSSQTKPLSRSESFPRRNKSPKRSHHRDQSRGNRHRRKPLDESTNRRDHCSRTTSTRANNSRKESCTKPRCSSSPQRRFKSRYDASKDDYGVIKQKSHAVRASLVRETNMKEMIASRTNVSGVCRSTSVPSREQQRRLRENFVLDSVETDNACRYRQRAVIPAYGAENDSHCRNYFSKAYVKKRMEVSG